MERVIDLSLMRTKEADASRSCARLLSQACEGPTTSLPSAPASRESLLETASLTASSARTPLEILRAVFGHKEFRGEQAAITAHVIGCGDAIVLMPTGGGKSVCYQIPALCRPGVAVVVSPLIALMADQVASLRQAGVKAAAL